MAIRNLIIAIAAALLALSAPGAQPSAPGPGGAAAGDLSASAEKSHPDATTYYYSLNAEGEPLFTQVLRWEANPNALASQIIVNDSTGAEILNERRADAELEIHLAPGSYRYKIVTYNLLGKAEVETDWIDLTILKAEQPKITTASPGAIYMDALDGRVTITGDKLLPEGVVSLVPLNGKAPCEGKVVARKGDKEIVVLFPDRAFEPGEYSLTFADPGGITATLDHPFRIRFQRPVDLLASLGFSPYFSLADPWAVGTWPGTFKPLGLDACIDLFFIKQRWGLLGLGMMTQWRRMQGGETNDTLTSDFVLAGFDALYTHRFSRQLHGHGRFGGGLAWSHHAFDYDGLAGASISSYDPFVRVGIALQSFLPFKLYGEFGVDGTWVFLVGHYTLGISPVLRVGYRIF